MSKLFSHAATIFHVADPLMSAQYYRDNLGFDITFEWGNPVDYVVTNREEAVSIHFSKKDEIPVQSKKTSLYIFVHHVDSLYEELQQKTVNIIEPLTTHDYGMRDFTIRDPDGYVICFGIHKDLL